MIAKKQNNYMVGQWDEDEPKPSGSPQIMMMPITVSKCRRERTRAMMLARTAMESITIIMIRGVEEGVL